MHEIFAALENGAVLLTATRRLARVLRREYADRQRDCGRTVWQTPDIVPLDAFVARLWTEWVAQAGSDEILLSGPQQFLVWQGIIAASPQAESLLTIHATAQRALDAWRLIHQYRIPLDGRFAALQDSEAFASWAREYKAACSRRGWIDAARLPDIVLGKVRAGDIARPTQAWHAGFDELAPQQRDFLDGIGAREWQIPRNRAAVKTRVCATAEDEIRCAAAWARDVVDRDPSARVGVIALSVPQLRTKLERIFRDELQPGTLSSAEMAFHISLGLPLDEYPLIYAAFLILEFAAGPMRLDKAGMLLRSPFLAGAGEERDARALVDVKLRNQRLWQISLDDLRSQCGSEVRRLLKALKALFGVLAEMEEKSASHAGWSRAFWSMLDAVGWPGDRLLNSREHQLLARWRDLLSEFAALDAVGGTVSLEGAVRRLRRLAASVIFQFEDRGAPIQISDAREAAGMRFDHVWIMGLHDEALPAPADPNPFVPISLQREYGAPNASAEHQFEGSRGLFERLASCAAEVVLSFPQTEGDRLMMPSPFLSARPESTAPPGSRWIARMRAAPAIETIVDENAPPVPEGVQRGGAYVLRDMAACPFRAFAAHRLGARELDGVEAGLSARDKGSALHRVMERIWREVGSQARLLSLSPEQISELIRRHIASVLDQYAGTTNAAVERIRLERLVTTWMRLERLRPDFKVAALEEKREVNIGGLRLEIRADRVDELTDGRRLILDYKSGEVKSKAWIGERPDEPQLPLYCVSANAPLAGAAFARIRAEGVEFAGIVESELPDFTDFGKNQPCLDEQLRHWRAVLSSLAERFGRGEAQVDPKYGRKTCEHCAIIPLCRIRERQSD